MIGERHGIETKCGLMVKKYLKYFSLLQVYAKLQIIT